MAVQLEMDGLPVFDCHGDPTCVGQRWRRWKGGFEIFVVARGIKDDTQKRALLLHKARLDVQEIFHTLEDTGGEKNIPKLWKHYRTISSPKLT